jgi:L-histidine Nalpha-methyltransferase
MSSLVTVTIHASQFPDAVQRDLLESLRQRRINHKFHYDNVKQTHKWLALHAAHSPSRNDPDCVATYDRSFAGAVSRLALPQVHVVGLGCGGGQKDSRLLGLLRATGRAACYTPCDVSTAMVLVAREAARAAVPGEHCFPLVCDLATTTDLPEVIDSIPAPRGARLVTFFGMIPNFEPADILPKLAKMLRPEDALLFSANLAPGADYTAGIQRVLPQYDNALTRDWLLTFLLDLGVERGDGELRFGIEEATAGTGLKRVVAHFFFAEPRRIEVGGERFEFHAGDRIRMFFSHRYTPACVGELLAAHGLRVADEWTTRSGEEGIFLVRRT